MFFEGSEKKVEVVMTSNSDSLRSFDKGFWEKLVSLSNAEILSSIHNEQCDAYILSESSLFVWHDRFLMLTCGNSTLVNSIIGFLDAVNLDDIQSVKYQRHKEYHAHLQVSRFTDDAEKLKTVLNGKAYRVGHLDSHHHYVFHYQKSNEIKVSAVTELLMYHLSGEVANYLRSPNQTKEAINRLLKLDAWFSDFMIGEHLFKPFGYSVNGIAGDKYFTFHITPQESGSYLSFETNINLAEQQPRLLIGLLDIFKPGCWDVIQTNANEIVSSFEDTLCIGQCDLQIGQGNNIIFKQYQQPWHQQLTAVEL
ncbi:adenosylmethionine decarboxylase [Parashewanella tropica]|uniref:adenosylmethionine decarboxylase n=1 Tax=Parashewanella tropica TaxID=2547970 RepID=UPI0010594487|nr:adenosylmethionine decarboxylase [Parashewanella tropica]